MPFVTEVKEEYNNILVFIIKKSVFGFNKDVVLVCAYLPPEHSPYYKHSKIDSEVCILEQFGRFERQIWCGFYCL